MSILFFSFLKNGSTKEVKSNKHKGKKYVSFFKVRPTYNELQIRTIRYLKPSKMSEVCVFARVCVLRKVHNVSRKS